MDWSGRNFCGLKFDWEYNKGQVDISMLNYAIDLLKRLQHTQQQPRYSPHAHLPIIYGKAGQRQYTAIIFPVH